jgi:putative phosphoribosyl transferase
MNQPSQTFIDVGKDVRVGPHELPGILAIPTQAKGIVIFAHGSGSSRLSSRNQYVAEVLYEAGLDVRFVSF